VISLRRRAHLRSRNTIFSRLVIRGVRNVSLAVPSRSSSEPHGRERCEDASSERSAANRNERSVRPEQDQGYDRTDDTRCHDEKHWPRPDESSDSIAALCQQSNTFPSDSEFHLLISRERALAPMLTEYVRYQYTRPGWIELVSNRGS